MMLTPLLAEFTAWHYLFTAGLSFLSVFLVLVILVQRGRGGGLTGALGGMGGQSAFGTKAGDLFTRITIGVAAFWIVLCTITVKVLGVSASTDIFETGTGTEAKPTAAASAPANTDGPAGSTADGNKGSSG